jgi:S-adenosylmethionine decarboxylase
MTGSKLAPEIFRQRLLLETYYDIELDQSTVSRFLLELAAALKLRTYGEPIVFAPSSGVGRDENAGYDGFVPLIDSGISIYVWTQARFVSLVIYTCKGFDEERAGNFTREFFNSQGEFVSQAF